MVVGKTYQTCEADYISNLSEVDILAAYFNVKRIPCIIKSPFRQDNHPSFNIYTSNDKVKYLDFATGEHGSLWDLLGKVWGCGYYEVLNKVCSDFIQKSNIKIQSHKIKNLTKEQRKQFSKLKVKTRPWRNYDIEYWSSYGVSLSWLKYAEVYPITHKTVINFDPETNKQSQFTFRTDKYAYAFIEHKEGEKQLKIYQPFNTKGFKWCSKMDGSVVSLWTKIPEYGDKVIICSSLKDALCIRTQLDIPTLALQGEGYSISNTAINELK